MDHSLVWRVCLVYSTLQASSTPILRVTKERGRRYPTLRKVENESLTPTEIDLVTNPKSVYPGAFSAPVTNRR